MTLNYAQKSVAINRTFQLTPVFTPAKPTNTAVTWKSSDDKVASVSSKGLVKGLKGGTAIIFCTSQDGNYSASCIVTVNEIITSLSLNKSSYKLGLGKSITLKATIKTNTSTKQTLRWTSSNTSIATVSKKGKIIAKKVGKCTITAKATDGSGESATCTIYVVRQATSLSLNKAVVTVIEGKSVKLRAYIKPSNSTYRSVTWSSNDEGIAIVDASGRVTGFKAGVTKVKATTKDNSNKTAYCVINVIKEIAASSVIVSTKDMTLIKGQTGTVSVSVQPSNTTDKISYASDNRAIATVTNKGKITAKRAGNATVTITTSSGKQATVNVTVIGLNKTSMTMEQYSTDVLTVDGASSTTTTITWFSSNPSIATVDSTGKVVATKSGTTTIYATINGIRLSCNVRVNNIPSN
jgi:Bacterial surface proteins containing Ig-like domains